MRRRLPTEPSPAEVLHLVDDAIVCRVLDEMPDRAAEVCDLVALAVEDVRRRLGVTSVWAEAIK